MRNLILSFLFIILFLSASESAPLAQIIVEDASSTTEKPLIVNQFSSIEPRIMCEYTSMITENELTYSEDLVNETLNVKPRILVEYSTSITHISTVAYNSCLLIFAAYFGRTNCIDDCKGDFNVDSDVDGSDIISFNDNFLFICFPKTD